MEDTNIMTVHKYVPKTDGAKSGSGYDGDNKQVIEPSFVRTQTTVDYDTQNFKYGLEYSDPVMNKYSDPNFMFQDPLFPSFDIILDTYRSPLFITENGPYYKYSLSNFLSEYGSIYSIRTRIKLHEEFLKILYSLFNTEFNQVERNKSYYINEITGLQFLTKKMIEFEKDKITITLNEDVSMISSYLANLYKNLVYSYRDQRQMIPANLLRFNMYIRISDIRNMIYYIPESNGTGTTTKYDKSYIIYLLKDCNFDFFNSKNHEDNLSIAGFNTSRLDTPSSLKFDICFKSVEIESENPLIMDNLTSGVSSIKLNNKDKDILGDNMNEVFLKNELSPSSFNEEINKLSKINNRSDVSEPIPANQDGGTKEGVPIATYETHEKTFGKVSSDSENSNRQTDLESLEKIYDGTDLDLMTRMDRYNAITDISKISDETGVDLMTGMDRYNAITDALNIKETGEYNETYWIKDVYDRMSYLDQLNSVIYAEKLFQLPFIIMNMFFGGNHGLAPPVPPLYINTYAPPIPYPENWEIDTTIKIKDEIEKINVNEEPSPRVETNLGSIDIEARRSELVKLGYINIESKRSELLDLGFIELSLRPPVPMPIINLHDPVIPSAKLDLGVIPFSLKPPQQTNMGYIGLEFKPPIPIPVIDLHPTIPYSTPSNIGNMNFVPKPLESIPVIDLHPTIPYTTPSNIGNMNFVPKPLAPMPVIDLHPTIPYSTPSNIGNMNFVPKPLAPMPVIDLHPTIPYRTPNNLGFIPFNIRPLTPIPTIDLHPTIPYTTPSNLGFIPFSIRPLTPIPIIDLHPTIPYSTPDDLGTILLEVKQSKPIPVIDLHPNDVIRKTIDMGFLYVGLNKENILPITYLYTKTNKFNDLEEYYTYNNSFSLIKNLNNITIDNTIRNIEPLSLIYMYDNVIDVKKTLTNITLFNNYVNKNNSLEFKLLYNKEDSVKIFEPIILYPITIKDNSLAITYIYDDESIKSKLVELGNISVDDIKEKKYLKDDVIYEQTTIIKKLLEPIKLFEPINKPILDLGRIYENINKTKETIQEFDQNRKDELDEVNNFVAEYDKQYKILAESKKLNIDVENQSELRELKIDIQKSEDKIGLDGLNIIDEELKIKKVELGKIDTSIKSEEKESLGYVYENIDLKNKEYRVNIENESVNMGNPNIFNAEYDVKTSRIISSEVSIGVDNTTVLNEMKIEQKLPNEKITLDNQKLYENDFTSNQNIDLGKLESEQKNNNKNILDKNIKIDENQTNEKKSLNDLRLYGDIVVNKEDVDLGNINTEIKDEKKDDLNNERLR